jgi:uncharacterized membrane protein YozB (DUF420 family)
MGQTFARRTAWGFCTFLCFFTGVYALRFVAVGFADVPEDVASNAVLSPGGLRFHIGVTAVAIIVAPWQFARGLRNRHPLVHRTMGRIYLVAGFLGIGTGTVIALGSSQGLIAGTGFLCLGLTWISVTAVAYRMILARDYEAHRRWMLRSFALIFGAVTLRIYIPVSFALGFSFGTSYPAIAWLAWVPNLLLMEWWIRRERPHRQPEPVPAGSRHG